MTRTQPTGTMHTPFFELAGMPIQPAGATGGNGTVDVLREYEPGLKDFDDFSHIVLFVTTQVDSRYTLNSQRKVGRAFLPDPEALESQPGMADLPRLPE
jgi:tRNA (Thr-GGU) A37 N-methylase